MHTPAIRRALHELDHAADGSSGLQLVRWQASPWVVRWSLGELAGLGLHAGDIEREPALLWTRLVAEDRDRLRDRLRAIGDSGVVEYRVDSERGERWVRESVLRVHTNDHGVALVSFARELAAAPVVSVPRRSVGLPAVVESGPLVLVVEDDVHVRSVIARMLRREGHGVLEAGSTREALHIWERTPQAIRVLVTDVILPDRPGTDLAQVLLRRNPELGTVFVSGYAVDDLRVRVRLPAEAAFLAKPFRPRELIRTVRAVLARPAGGGGAIEGPRSAV